METLFFFVCLEINYRVGIEDVIFFAIFDTQFAYQKFKYDTHIYCSSLPDNSKSLPSVLLVKDGHGLMKMTTGLFLLILGDFRSFPIFIKKGTVCDKSTMAYFV